MIIPDNIEYIYNTGLGYSDLESFIILDRGNERFGAHGLGDTKLKEFIAPYNCKLSLGGCTFCNDDYLEKVIISNHTVFDWGVFANLENLEIIFSSEITSLGSDLFMECKNITLTIPETITEISDVFLGGSENVTIITPKGSVAEQYALRHKFKVINY